MSKILQHRSIDSLPPSLVEHLARIKKFAALMNPSIKDDYLVNMLNRALQQRMRMVGVKAYAKAIADDVFPEVLKKDLASLIVFGFDDLLKCEGGKGYMTQHALMLLLEDGLHPLASLSGWLIGEGAQRELESREDKTLCTDQTLALFPHRSDVMSAFYQPAILMMEQRPFWASIAPQRAARQLHRFAQHLSKDDDLLGQLHREFFDPSSRHNPSGLSKLRLQRSRPLENNLQSAIGRVLDLHPELDTGSIKDLNWPQAIVRNWIMCGHLSELPPGVHPADFTDDFERYFSLMPAVTLHYLPAYESGHPLKDHIEKAFLTVHASGKRAINQGPDDMIVSHPYEVVFRPDLAAQIGRDYDSLHQGLFSDFWQHCNLDFIDYALGEFSATWGRPAPSQDPALIAVNAIGRHKQWISNNHDAIAPLLEPLLQSKKTLPQGLVNGSVPLSVIPDHLLQRFVTSLLSGSVSREGIKRIHELLTEKRINHDAIAPLLEPLLQSMKTLPQALVNGAVPLSVIPDHLLEPFVKSLLSGSLSREGFKRIDELLADERIGVDAVLPHVQGKDDFLLLAGNPQLKKCIMEDHSEMVAEEILVMDLGL
ncbi:hypothetical protein RBE51_22025 [Pseudomonas taiwanensis]|uniref:hypothetical protein n=1 Tax=Pseudomonas taiwanensis TaxID=470150 RepID=UPI0028DF420D|nr:hypothetical protein [Pseudomonas taiwanensis]MDT8925466.1 hypothetical protein [Pseudomonas taiwanensis]